MKYEATVTRTVQETADVRTVYFTVDGPDTGAAEASADTARNTGGGFPGNVLPFTAGQYVTISFDDIGAGAGKAYSLSSTPWDAEMSVTVKNIGLFSGRICSLRPGDTFLVSAPYGFFNVQSAAPIVALVAGVGISPVWSIVRDELRAQPNRPVRILYSSARREGRVFGEQLQALVTASAASAASAQGKQHTVAAAPRGNVRVTFFTTQEPAPDATARRICPAKDVTAEEIAQAVFYLCGSEAFVRSMWRQLMECAVDETRIVTEIFFEDAL